jgi:hypothetical protein
MLLTSSVVLVGVYMYNTVSPRSLVSGATHWRRRRRLSSARLAPYFVYRPKSETIAGPMWRCTETLDSRVL